MQVSATYIIVVMLCRHLDVLDLANNDARRENRVPTMKDRVHVILQLLITDDFVIKRF